MKKQFIRYFGGQLPFRLILFNIICIVALAGGLISLGVSLANGLPMIQNIVVGISILMLFVCIYLANAKQMLRGASIVIIILISLILMPLVFFTGGGAYSGMSSWFVLGMVFTFLLIEGKLCWVFAAAQGLLYTGCYLAAFYYPEMIKMFPSESGIFIDIVQSMFIAAFTIGLIMRFQGMAYDKAIGNIIEQNRQLEEATREANQANTAKTEFLSHMSHDIRTPINGIIGMLDIAERNPDDPERQADCMKKIRISSMHLLSLINDILDISMLESGRVEFSEEVFNLRELIENCMTITHEKAEEKHIRFSFREENDIPARLVGSPLHVRQVLINILGNAVKYNREGGSVSVTVQRLHDSEAVRPQDGTVRIRITVKDTGVGMSKEYLRKLFEPFTQEKSGARSSFTGSGLGMAITKDLIGQMGGTIRVASVQGEGSIFTAELPFRPAAQVDMENEAEKTTADSLSSAEEKPLDGMKLLLVEDNALNSEIAEYILKNSGAEVVRAGNGAEAVRAFSDSGRDEFDCILMDIMMPVMDGIEAAQKIRAMDRPDALTVPIVAMTANAYAEDMRKTKAAGMNEHLTKPLDNKKMIEVIAGYRKP